MPERTISTKLVLSGEKEYRAQMQAINRELKALESALKLADNEFKGQQNTLAALQAKHKALTDVIAKQAEKYKAETDAIAKNKQYQQEAAAAAEKVRQQMEQLSRTTSEADKQTDAYQKQMEELKAALTASENAEQKAAEAVTRHTTAANNAKVKLNDLNGQLSANEKYLDEAKASSDGCAKSIDAMGNEAKDTGESFQKMGEQGAAGIDALAAALAAAGVVGTLKEIAEGIKACLDASIEFESAMTGVAKTTDLSGEELAVMSEKIQELSQRIPLTTTELAQIAETGGQLGIAKEDLLSFTEVMANLGVATNMTSEEAAVMLAQFANITGMDSSLYSNLGSAIVDLGNSFATNEKKITDMAQSVAAAGNNAGMSAPDILALSAAVTSLGIEAGTGGNNLSSLIGDMQMAVETGEDLELWAKAAGMSAQEFATLWGTDATEALRRFIGNLGTTEESARATLAALGQNDDRLVRMVTSLNSAEKSTGLLTRALEQSESAWNQNAALLKEAETRYATTESKQQILANSINNLKIAVGDQLKPAMNDLLDTGTEWAQWATEFVESNQQIVPVMTAVVAAVGTFVGGLTGLAVVVGTAQKALAALNVVLTANPWVLAAAAIAAVAAAIGTLVMTSQGANQEVQALATAQENLNTAMTSAETAYSTSVAEIEAQSSLIGELCNRLDELAGKSSLTAEEQAEQSRIVNQLNTMLPGLNASIDAQTGVLNTSTEAIRKQTEAWKEQQIALAVAENRQKLVEALVAAETEYKIALQAREEREQSISALEAQREAMLGELARQMDTTADSLRWMTAEEMAEHRQTQLNIQGAEDYSDAALAKEASIKNLIGAIDENIGKTADLETANAESEEAFNSLGEAADEAREKLGKYDEVTQDVITTSTEMPKAAEKTAEALADQAEAYKPVIDKLEELTEYQKKVQEATKQQVASVVSGFEEIVPPAEKSVEDTIKALESQIVYMDNFGSLVQQALAKGYKASLIAELSDGSEQSTAILTGLVNASEEKVGEVNTAWEGKLKQSEELATELADAKLAADEGYQTLVQTAVQAVNDLNQQDLAYAAGEATVNGLVNGLRSQLGTVSALVAQYNATLARLGSTSSGWTGKVERAIGGSHAQGLDYVPYDGYVAELHKGERVQTAMEAKAQRALDVTNYGAMRRFERMLEASGTTNNSNFTANFYMQGSGKKEMQKAADELAARLRYKGVLLR